LKNVAASGTAEDENAGFGWFPWERVARSEGSTINENSILVLLLPTGKCLFSWSWTANLVPQFYHK